MNPQQILTDLLGVFLALTPEDLMTLIHAHQTGITPQGDLVSVSLPGFEDANDSVTAGSPIALVADTWTSLTNDAGGGFSNTAYLPSGITSLFNGTTGKIDPTQLALGEAILVRNDFTITPNVNGAFAEFQYTLGTGGNAYTLPVPLGTLSNGGGIAYRFQFTDFIYMGDTNTRDNEIGLQVRCSEEGSVVNAGSAVWSLRRTTL